MGKTLRITARPEGGFRRCGIFHPPTATDHPVERFHPEAIARLKAEPQLVVQEVDAPDAPAPDTIAPDGPKGDGGKAAAGGAAKAKGKGPAAEPKAPEGDGGKAEDKS